ncbi:hypothetical protein HY025_05745 [Candidatus Daviesbacteria bacterium]|nr:hypothetical protein [Candidatus Daviesbacteria bacterium]
MESKNKSDIAAEAAIALGEGVVGACEPDFFNLTNDLASGRTEHLQTMITGERNWLGLQPGKLVQEGLDLGFSPITTAFLLTSLSAALAFDAGRRVLRLIKTNQEQNG